MQIKPDKQNLQHSFERDDVCYLNVDKIELN